MDEKTSGYWKRFYKQHDPDSPSAFCDFVIKNFLSSNDTVIELGCGNGRDAVALARQAHRYIGLDISPSATLAAHELLESCGLERQNFDFQTQSFAAVRRPSQIENRVLIYSRFSLHADSESAQTQLFENLSSCMEPGDLIMIETRTIHDELFGVGELVERNAYMTDHYRRFLDPADFPDCLPDNLKLLAKETRRGFAPYGDADPVVMRLSIQVVGT